MSEIIEKEQKGKDYWEERQNLKGLFAVLIEIDRRVNPHFYRKEDKEPKKND
jgi:hypothetical protein